MTNAVKIIRYMQDEGESLIDTATNDLIALTPSMLSIQTLIDEIGIHAAVTGLDYIEYGAFKSSILLLSTLNHASITMA